jgi:hypothetical protein
MENSDYHSYIEKFNDRMKKYIPARDDWTPVDHALYAPADLFRVPVPEAQTMQLRAIRYAFDRHYTHNKIYRNFCKRHGVAPEHIKTSDDLDKIPLIPDHFFKDYPAGRDFALWLGNIFTGSLPRIVIKRKNPTMDEVTAAFNASGLAVTFSSGTSGRHTFIPRDMRTFHASEYAIAKSVITMAYPLWDPLWHEYLLMPNPKKTNLFAGRACAVFFEVIEDVRVALDRDVTTELLKMTMTGPKGIKGRVVKYFAGRESRKMIAEIVRWLEFHEKGIERILLFGAPFILSLVMKKLQNEGRRFSFGDRGWVGTAGGWKSYEGARIPLGEFRRQVEHVLGIPEKYCLDMYALAESNACMLHCPEGHYLHVPYSFFKPLVLGADHQPLGYGEWGRFAFLDAAAFSYPGFIISGDMVRMLEHCPVCDRPGPVLEPEIRRAAGEEVRGCAEELRSMMAADLEKGDK